jgi:hypothetical protein
VSTLYDELGVDPGVSVDELRRAYYRRARELHPDVNPGRTDDAMRRLNQAWTVLSNPTTRRRYDLQFTHPVPAPARPTSPVTPPPAEPPMRVSVLASLVRPSALILAVLMVIFVVTAYAGKGGGGHPGGASTTTIPTTDAATNPAAAPSGTLPAPMGDCLLIQPGYDAMVPCNQPSNGVIVAMVTASAQCPAETTAHQLVGRAQWVCLAPVGPGPAGKKSP